MTKKIVTLALAAVLVVMSVAGATLAYLTDTDAKDNVFTVGKVDITLVENFEDNAKLLPATGSAQAGTLKNGVTKEVDVKLEDGSEDAYVRVHIAIPAILDDGADTFDAGKNVLHFNYTKDSIGEGKWDWSKTADDGKYEGNWNYYTTTIDDVDYNVYVVTYGTALTAGDTTAHAIHQVYLDSKVTNSDIAKINETLGANWEIKVAAEGVQATGFDNAYAALNSAFGVPGTYTVAWN